MFSLAFIMLAFSATAQDTIQLLGPKYNYLSNYWCFEQGDTVYDSGVGGKIALHFYEKDTITIYGIAAYIRVINGASSQSPVLLQLYKHTPTSFNQISETLEVYTSAPPTYYMQQDLVLKKNLLTYTPQPVFPVYESYFHNPVTVVDSFYVGYESPDWPDDFNIGLGGFVWHDVRVVTYPIPYMACLADGCGGYFWNYGHRADDVSYLYPILTPAPDDYEWDTIASGIDTTTVASDTIAAGDTLIVCDTVIVCDTLIVGYDTIINYDTIITYDTLLALPEAGLLGRLVGVMPNPAGTTAKVVSSFGLTMVEAFNMAGERVCTLRLPDAPLAATLDVSRWPSGSYLLRIHTPQGVITRKLMVRR